MIQTPDLAFHMATRTNPYLDLPPSAFWRTAVAEADSFGLSDMWTSRWVLPSDCRFATYGIPVDGAVEAYRNAILELPGLRAWLEEAARQAAT